MVYDEGEAGPTAIDGPVERSDEASVTEEGTS
jgi:hypothetical protein